jgi:hypothetical protein
LSHHNAIYPSLSTNNFWRPTIIYYGRPNIKFTNEIYVQAEIGGVIKSYSNVHKISQQITNPINGVMFKAIEIDEDDNRIADDFRFDLSFKHGAADAVSSIVILMHFKYYIEERLRRV